MSGPLVGELTHVPGISAAALEIDTESRNLAGSCVKLARHLIRNTGENGFTDARFFFKALYAALPENFDDLTGMEAAIKLDVMLRHLRNARIGEVALVQDAFSETHIGRLGQFGVAQPSPYRLVLEPESHHPEGQPDNFIPAEISGGLEIALHVLDEPVSDRSELDDEITPIRVAQVTTVYGERIPMYREIEDIGCVAVGKVNVMDAPHREFGSYVSPIIAGYWEFEVRDAFRFGMIADSPSSDNI